MTHILRPRKQHFSDFLTAIKNDMKKTWQIWKWLETGKQFERIQSKFEVDDQCTTETSLLYMIKSIIFVNIGLNFAKKIPEVALNPLQYIGLCISATLLKYVSLVYLCDM